MTLWSTKQGLSRQVACVGSHISATFLVSAVIAALLFAEPSLAWTCSHPVDASKAPSLQRAPNIFLGRVVEVSLVTNQANGDRRIQGKVAVIERLRGNSAKAQELKYDLPNSSGYGPGVTPSIDVGKPYLFLSDGGPLAITNCSKPLSLHPTQVAFGDGCRLYRYRQTLGLNQPATATCGARGVNAGSVNSPLVLTEYEHRVLRWKELGINWEVAPDS